MRSFRGSKEITFNDQEETGCYKRDRSGQRFGEEGPGKYDVSKAKRRKYFQKGVTSGIKIC